MRDRDNRWFDSGTRILGFTNDYSAKVRATPSGVTLCDGLGRQLEVFGRARADLETATALHGEGTAMREAARKLLETDVEAVARTARSIALEIPAFDEKFPMPESPSDGRLADIADAFARDASAYLKEFEAHGLPPAVITGLPGRATAMRDAVDRQRAGRTAKIQANTAVRESIEAHRTIVKGLHAIVMRGPRPDPAMVAVWRNARRLGPVVRRAPATAAAPAPSKPAA
jgi:hypothetical protein